ncbi:MAG: BadF/BadG/BcrA/BcrD ATPase family protein [Gammaproteobacteria bacterium]|jgi:N-acetylglucosamine kinase-like BadF-type ATPase
MGLIVGVDGGGTNSIYQVYDREKNKIHEFVGTSINFYSIGDAKAHAAFKEKMRGITVFFKQDIDAIYIGNSALGIGDKLDISHPFARCVAGYTKNFDVVSDLYICLRAVDAVPAIFLISGTGSMGMVEDRNGKIYTVSGWGPLFGDQGSGYYIGLRGIREAVKFFDGVGGSAVLLDRVKQYFDIVKLEDLIAEVYNPPIEKDIVAKFAIDVLEAAQAGDAVSKSIIENAAAYLVKCALKLYAQVGNCNVDLTVYGGCFRQSDYFYNLFKDKLHQQKKVKIKFPKYKPVEAALMMAGKLIDVEIPKELFQQGD